jgi:hypothetical protein
MGAETESPVTRRELFGLLEGADPAPSSDSRPTVESKDNPITKYPKPPFKRQSQPWPGLRRPNGAAAEPRRRELSRLEPLAWAKSAHYGRHSGMGRAVAIAFAREGADVAINCLPDEEVDAREVIALLSRRADRFGAARRSAQRSLLPRRRIARCRRVGHRREQSRPAANSGIDSRYLKRRILCDDEDQYLRPVLDHQGRPSPSEAGLHAERHGFGTGLRPFKQPIRLRPDQGGDRQLYEVACKAARSKGNPRQCGRSGLDTFAGQRRRDDGKAEHFGGQTPLGRPGQPAELGSIYVQLAANDASYVTGRHMARQAAVANPDKPAPRRRELPGIDSELPAQIVPRSAYDARELNLSNLVMLPAVCEVSVGWAAGNGP